jgi:hypothetical protein
MLAEDERASKQASKQSGKQAYSSWLLRLGTVQKAAQWISQFQVTDPLRPNDVPAETPRTGGPHNVE